MSWSKQNVIAFSQLNLSASQGRSEIAVINPNGSGEKCLTCGQSAIPHSSNDIPAWSPNGDYIVFESASPTLMAQSKRLPQSVLNSITQGGSGIDNNLWAMNASGTAYYQLTNVQAGEGVLHPVFSKDGSQLMWAAHVRVSGSAQAATAQIASAASATPPAGGRALLLRRILLRRAILRREGLLNNQGQGQSQGQASAQAIQARATPARPTFQWMLKVADFTVGPNGPELTNIRDYQPLGPTYFYESHDFFPDNTTVLFSASPPGPFNLDIYRMDLNTGQATNLTDSPNVWDEHAHISSDGKKIVWISSQGYPFTPTQNYGKTLSTDLWMMNPDGSDKQQITFFNTPGNPEDTGARVILADNSWNPTNDAVVVTRLSYPKNGPPSVSDVIVHFSSPQ